MRGGSVAFSVAGSAMSTFCCNYMGSWEVHSVVGLVSAGEDTLWGVLSLAGGDGPRCCFGMFRVRIGVTAAGCLLYFAP
jgi:hypothetical protein